MYFFIRSNGLTRMAPWLNRLAGVEVVMVMVVFTESGLGSTAASGER